MARNTIAAAMCGGVLAAAPHALAAQSTSTADVHDWLREIIVTAPRMQAPLTIEMDAKAPRQPLPANDGADYLKSVPGFSVIRKGGTDGDPVFRGMAGSRVNVLIDGEQILGGCGMRMDPPTAYVFPEAFDRIVIVKGPQTVLYGPGNSAATVRFERDPPQFTEFDATFHGSALAASADRRDLVADLAVGDRTLYAQFAGTHAQSEDYEDGAGEAVHSNYERWSANGVFGWTPSTNTRVELSGAQSDGEAAYADRMMDGARFERDSIGLRFTRTDLTSNVRKLEAQAFYNYVDHVMDNYSLRDFTPSMMMPARSASNPDRRTVGGRAAVELSPARQLIATVGFDVQQNEHSVRSTMNEDAAPYESRLRVQDARFTNAGVFAEATWLAAARGRLIAGARTDRWEAEDLREQVTLGMGAGPNPTANQTRETRLNGGFFRWEQEATNVPATLYAGVGRVERFPDYWESVAADRESVSSVSAFNTKPERTTQLDVGAVLRTSALQVSVSAFYSDIDDYILLQSGYPKGMRQTTVVRNVDAATFGAEADAAWALSSRWKLIGALAYTRGRNETDDLPLAQTPPLEVRLGVEYDDERWSFGALARGVADQERFALNQGNIAGQDLARTDGFATLALHGAWRTTNGVIASLGVDNAFDREYAEHLSRSGAMVAGYTRTTRVNEPGRTVWMRVAAEFK